MAGGATTFSRSFGGSGPVTFTNGVAVSLAGNTYSGATMVTSTGALAVNAAGALSPNSDFTVNGQIQLNGFNSTIQSLSGNGSIFNSTVPAPAATLTIAPTSGVTTFSGTLSDGSGGVLPLSLTKTGAGTLGLSGTNTYTGATTVNGGTLSVNGSIASSSLTTVNAGGTLGGNGTVGNTTIDGGTLAPGNSIGALTVAGNLAMTAASTYLVEVSPSNADFTHVTGTATLGGATVAAQFAPGAYVEKRYTILTADGGVNGTFSGPVNANLPQNFKSALAHDGNNALGSHDANSRVYGAMGGASYALSPATSLGFAFGGGGTSFGLSDGLGSGRSDLFQAGVFAHHGFAQGGYLSGAFAHGWHDVTTDRAVPTGERLRGAYRAGVLSGRLEAGWRIDTAFAGVTPYAAAQVISYRMPSYFE